MELIAANELAIDLMRDHGLIESGWSFSYDRSKRRNGCCNYTTKTISLSKFLTPGRTEAGVTNTILHEIAHALVGSKAGHGHLWKAKAIEIGCDGQRCSSDVSETKPEGAWVATCDHCDFTSSQHRAPLRVSSCSKCNPHGFSWNHVLSWSHNGQVAYVEDMTARFKNEYYRMAAFYERDVVIDESVVVN